MAATDDTNIAQPTAAGWADDLLIYVPGLPRSARNSADTVAEVVAATLDPRPGQYRADSSTATAPRELRVAKSVVGPTGTSVLDVFELDYRERMAEANATKPGADALPGALGSLRYTLAAVIRLCLAFGNQAKSRRAKVQLFLGLVGVLALLASTVGLLAAAVGWLGFLPDWVKNLGIEESGPTAVAGATAGTLTWVALRRYIRLLAGHLREAMRYLGDSSHRNTVTQTLDRAIDGLLDAGCTSRIHVVGYSFGSLVAVDALLPRAGTVGQGNDRIAKVVASLTTIGCPIDAIRVFYPKHFAAPRRSRVPDLRWTNVFVPADVFGSNLADKTDSEPIGPDDVVPMFEGVTITARQHTDQQLGFLTTLEGKGFALHGGYWSEPDRDSCFTMLVDTWVPIVIPEDAVPTARTGGSRATPVDQPH